MNETDLSKRTWDRLHRRFWRNAYRGQRPTRFGFESARTFAPLSRILEIGSGGGQDAVYFGALGHSVVATDVSSFAVENCLRDYPELEKVTFLQHDTRALFPFGEQDFDIVYSRLSLHYFTDSETRGIFRELARLLSPGGRLVFMVKSKDAPEYGLGRQIEKDVYVLQGEQRHFFCEDYVFSLLTSDALFEPEFIRGRRLNVYGSKSAVLKVSARRCSKDSQLLLF